MKFVGACIVAIALSGCTPPPPINLPPITAADVSAYSGPATSYVKGQAFLRQQGGGVVTCAGSNVLLMPDIPTARALVTGLAAGGSMPTQKPYVDQRAKPLFQQSVCDAQGNFTLGPVPAGAYMVGTDVKWSVGYAAQGGSLLKHVVIAKGETAQILLTDSDYFTNR